MDSEDLNRRGQQGLLVRSLQVKNIFNHHVVEIKKKDGLI